MMLRNVLILLNIFNPVTSRMCCGVFKSKTRSLPLTYIHGGL